MYFTSNLTYGVIWATDCCEQCDQKKIDKCLEKLPKSDFTRKMNDFNAFKKLHKNVGDLGKSIVAKGLKRCPKSNKSPDLVTLIVRQ